MLMAEEDEEIKEEVQKTTYYSLIASQWCQQPPITKLTAGIVALLISAIVLIPIVKIFLFPSGSIFNISAESDIAIIELQGKSSEQQWSLLNAIICSADGLSDIKNILKTSEHNKLCEDEYSYTIKNPGTKLTMLGETNISMKVENGVTLSMFIESNSDSANNLFLASEDQLLYLPSNVNFYWHANKTHELIFPFMGNIVIGNDISDGATGMLHKGKISVYTSDITSTSQRTLIDETELILGDKVELNLTNQKVPDYPKGFIRYKPGNEKRTLEIVSIGNASGVNIVRYGDSGKNNYFKPGFWAKMLKDPFILIIETLLITMLTLLATVGPLFHPTVKEEPVDDLNKAETDNKSS